MFNKREKQLQRIVQAFVLATARSPHEHTLDDLCSFLSREDLEVLIEGITDQANAVEPSVTDARQQRLYDLAIELNNRLKQ
jgi:HEPN domain-containing protein